MSDAWVSHVSRVIGAIADDVYAPIAQELPLLPRCCPIQAGLPKGVSKRTLSPCDQQSAAGGVGSEMERSARPRPSCSVAGLEECRFMPKERVPEPLRAAGDGFSWNRASWSSDRPVVPRTNALRCCQIRAGRRRAISKRTLSSCDQQSAARGVRGEMERSAPERGLLEVEGRQRAAVRQLQQPARCIVGERRARSGEIVDVNRVASTKILELRAEVRR